MTTLVQKRGDSFIYTLLLPDTLPIDNTWTGEAHLRNAQGVKIADLDFSWLTSKRLELRKNNTKDWAIATDHYFDIECVSPSGEIASIPSDENIFLNVIGDATYDDG